MVCCHDFGYSLFYVLLHCLGLLCCFCYGLLLWFVVMVYVIGFIDSRFLGFCYCCSVALSLFVFCL